MKLLKEVARSPLLIYSLIFVLFSLVLITNFTPRGNQQFSILAEGILQKRLDMPRMDPFYADLDMAIFNGKLYWAELPFSGIMLTPFVYIFENLGLFFYQGYLQFFLTVSIFFICFKLASHYKYSRKDSLLLALAFTFSSIYSYIAFFSESWYFGQAVTTFLLFLSLYEWFGRKNLTVLSFYLFLLVLTRFTVIFGVLLFIALTLFENKLTLKDRIDRSLTLFIPVFVAVLLVFGYNQARFDSPFVTGHEFNNVFPYSQVLMREQYGLFKLSNIPSNIYWYFISPPTPIFEQGNYHLIPPFFRANEWGMSFFIVSPIFIFIFKTLKKSVEKENLFIWLSTITTLLVLLSWHSTGFVQLGPRYMLDLLPFWFILLLKSFEGRILNTTHKTIIIVGIFTNLFWISQFL